MKEFIVRPDDENILALLKKIERFSEISEKDLQLFVKAGKIREYQPNETVIKEGDIDSWAYFLLSGTLRIHKKGKDVGTLRRLGDVFGEMDSLGGSSRTSSVTAVSKAITLGIDTSFVNDQLQGDKVYFSYMIYRIFAEVQAVRLRAQIEENERLESELLKMQKSTGVSIKSSASCDNLDLSNKKILIVDQNESVRKMLKTILMRELNCSKVFEVINGDKAVSFLIENEVDLIISELDLPKMSGLELLDNVKQMMGLENTPFIVYCSESKSSIDKLKKAADDQITHYKSTQCIVLPFTANTVIAKVKKTFASVDKLSIVKGE